jgi:dihydrofolate reductase
MTKVTVDISMSLDGYIAGPDATRAEPLGRGGLDLHEWVFATRSWRDRQRFEGGESGPDSDVVERAFGNYGAVVMGRRMFGSDDGPWGDDPWEGFWGEEPPFNCPVYVLTSHAREPLEKHGGTTFYFVTDGINSALEQAKAEAGHRNVTIAGGADVIQQYLRANAIHELHVHLVPRFLGSGTRLFQNLEPRAFERVEVVDSPTVTHIRYRLRDGAA